MKKILGLIALTILTITSIANATSWNWDLTNTGVVAAVDGDPYSTDVHFNDYIGFVNQGNNNTQITQTFSGGANDNILDNGDIFSEFGLIKQINVDEFPVNFRDADTRTTKYYGYISFSGLSGFITNYQTNDAATSSDNFDTNLADDTFDLVFNPGVGEIKFYLDTDYDPSNGAINLASMKLLAGVGTSAGTTGEGQFGMVAGITSIRNDVWSFDDGTLFEEWMDAFGIPSIFMTSFNLGATLKDVNVDDTGNLVFDVFNHGDFHLSAVPEPSTLLLLGGGLLGLGFLSRRKKKA